MGVGDMLDQTLLGRLEGDSILYSGQWLQGSISMVIRHQLVALGREDLNNEPHRWFRIEMAMTWAALRLYESLACLRTRQ